MYTATGANINAQTEETQETALTLACCGGFLEVADFLIKAGADIELGCSTPLMEAAQEGHLELVKYLLAAGEQRRGKVELLDVKIEKYSQMSKLRVHVSAWNPNLLRFG